MAVKETVYMCVWGGGNRRASNLELLRIITILAIIAHHYVVNSGLTGLYNFKHITGNMIFLQIFGMFGKTGINIFTLITGYFMVESNISIKKFIKLFLQVKFWYILFYLIFLITGYEPFSLKLMFKTIFSTVYESGSLYVGTFLIFYLCIPFLNLLIKSMDKRQYEMLLVLAFTYFTVFPAFFAHETFNFTVWLCIMYFMGGYIKLFPCKYFNKRKYVSIMIIIVLFLDVLSILIVDFIGSKMGFENYYYMVAGPNKFLAVMTAVSIFIWFKNTEMRYSKIVNTLASATFGILLIHANSDTMRRFLWNSLFKNTMFYDSSYLAVHAFACVFSVYVLSFVLESLRSKYIERPYINLAGKLLSKFRNNIKF